MVCFSPSLITTTVSLSVTFILSNIFLAFNSWYIAIIVLNKIVDYKINKNINLNTGDNINIYADSDKLSRVFNNLIKNAINYSKENTDIDINVKKRNKEIEVKIINQGKMIPKDKLDKIFENFYRLDTSRTSKTGGSGLGLAISKQIVELHGGNIKVNSDKNKTIFTIILPIEEE